MHKCKNGHTIDNILLSELENTQLIDESKIIWDKCKINNKGNTYNKEMFICNKCNMNLCPLCKSKHNNTIMINIIYAKSIIKNIIHIVNNVKKIFVYSVKRSIRDIK